MRVWVVGIGVVLLTAAGIGLVTAATGAPACFARPEAVFGGGATEACAAARTEAIAAGALAVGGTFVAVLGAAWPPKAPAPAATACAACGRRVEAAHGFCPACGALRPGAP